MSSESAVRKDQVPRTHSALRKSAHAFHARDGLALRLTRIQTERDPWRRNPVVLVHGAGVRSGIFLPPLPNVLPVMLAESGHDVWLLDWRGSIEIPPNEWTLDAAAVNDYAPAIDKICEVTGADCVSAVIHCQGSTSFMMALVAGLLPRVTTVVSNAVALHTIVPTPARLKSHLVTRSVGYLFDYLNPQWGIYAAGFWPKVIDWSVRATHHECRNAVCRHASFTFGSGFPTLWRHENLDDATHEWLKGEFAHVPMSFFRQMDRCLSAGHLVSTGKYPDLPRDFLAQAPATDARIVFLAGELNACFKAEGVARTYDFFERFAPGRHAFYQMAGYGHLDIFIGRNAGRDVLPVIVDELGRA